MRSEVGDLLWLEHDTIDHNESVAARAHLVEAIERAEGDEARRQAEALVATDTGRLVQLRLQAYLTVTRTESEDDLPGRGR